MPVLHIPYRMISRHAVDISAVVADLAVVLHGAHADHNETPISRWGESHRQGRVFVDSIEGDTLNLTWTLPHGDNVVEVGKLKIVLGRAGSEYIAIADLSIVDGKGVAHVRSSPRTYPGDAIKDIWAELWGPQQTWTTLTSHLSMPVSPGNPGLAASIQSASLWIHNLAVIPLFFIYMITRASANAGAPPEELFPFWHALVLLGAGGVVMFVVALARRILVLNPMVKATATALKELIPHRR